MNIAFCSVAFGERYVEQLWRLKESIEKIHPEASFYYWVNEYPPGAKTHEESYYGFKVHAINHARAQGHTRIVWVDTAIIVVDRLDWYFEKLVPHYGVVAAKDDNKLDKCCGQAAWDYFEIPRNNYHHLVGGSLFVFDFENDLCQNVFAKWEQAEKDGMFGSKHNDSKREFRTHRHDESCLSLSLYKCGSEPVPYGDAGYNQVPNPTVIKKHFK